VNSKVEEAIKHFESLQKRYTTQHNGKQCELVKTALEALYEKKEREQTENKPLTLEELIEIDGEPVWITLPFNKYTGHWAICYGLRDRKKHGRELVDFGMGSYEYMDEYGEEWIAYRNKPKEEREINVK